MDWNSVGMIMTRHLEDDVSVIIIIFSHCFNSNTLVSKFKVSRVDFKYGIETWHKVRHFIGVNLNT